MNDEAAFLAAILARPDDVTARLVYADWLDDRADPRAMYLRLGVKAAESLPGSAERTRLREMQIGLPTWWLAVVGFRATPQEPDNARIEEAARLLGRPVRYTDADGTEVSIRAAAISGLTGSIAYLEERSEPYENAYRLCLSDPAGREAFGPLPASDWLHICDPQFLEWYGDEALLIYCDGRRAHMCRLGFAGPLTRRALGYGWVLDGRELGFRSYGDDIRRLSVPDLAELPPLSLLKAVARELLPSN